MIGDKPMTRISIIPDDPGYCEDYGNYYVLLDGEKVSFVKTADEITGEVLCNLLDERGEPVQKDGEWVWQTRTGRVRIRRIDER